MRWNVILLMNNLIDPRGRYPVTGLQNLRHVWRHRPATGPVFSLLPMNVMEELTERERGAPSIIDRRRSRSAGEQSLLLRAFSADIRAGCSAASLRS